jgi:hypothetical protein
MISRLLRHRKAGVKRCVNAGWMPGLVIRGGPMLVRLGIHVYAGDRDDIIGAVQAGRAPMIPSAPRCGSDRPRGMLFIAQSDSASRNPRAGAAKPEHRPYEWDERPSCVRPEPGSARRPR